MTYCTHTLEPKWQLLPGVLLQRQLMCALRDMEPLLAKQGGKEMGSDKLDQQSVRFCGCSHH